jgi:predicted small lipoprotein YifL
MILRLFMALALLVTVAGCGVKSDLDKPDGQPTQKGEKDNSKPPAPLGR